MATVTKWVVTYKDPDGDWGSGRAVVSGDDRDAAIERFLDLCEDWYQGTDMGSRITSVKLKRETKAGWP